MPEKWDEHLKGRMHCADCLEFMADMPAGSVDLVVTSPPYNLLNSSGNGMQSDGFSAKWRKPRLVGGYDTHEDRMPHEKYVAWQRQCLEAMLRLIPDDGAIFYNHKWRVQHGLIQDRSDIVEGMPVRQIIIWQRAGALTSPIRSSCHATR